MHNEMVEFMIVKTFDYYWKYADIFGQDFYDWVNYMASKVGSMSNESIEYMQDSMGDNIPEEDDLFDVIDSAWHRLNNTINVRDVK